MALPARLRQTAPQAHLDRRLFEHRLRSFHVKQGITSGMIVLRLVLMLTCCLVLADRAQAQISLTPPGVQPETNAAPKPKTAVAKPPKPAAKPAAKPATPQQIPNAAKRQDFNNGLRQGQKQK